jgi:serine/threonine-protein phosphatase PGAM5
MIVRRVLLLVTALCALAAPAWPQTPPPSSPPGKGIHYLLLIRHGAYVPDRNTDDRVADGLNPLGHEQARAIGERLAKLPIRIDTLVSSDFTRARETADDIGRAVHMQATRDSLIHECQPHSDRPDTSSEGRLESEACEANLAAAWDKYFKPTPAADRHDVLVCHGNVIRWMVVRAIGADTKRWRGMDIANGSLTVIAVLPDGGTRLVMFSDVGHLPTAKQSWLYVGNGWGMTPPPPAPK